MSETMLDAGAFSESLPATRSRNQLSKPLLQLFVASDADGATSAGRGHGAANAHGAVGADLGIELDDGSRREALGLAGRTGDGEIAHVDVEVAFGEKRSVARDPGFAEHLAALGEELRHQVAAYIPAVDGQLADLAAWLASQILTQGGNGLFFGPIGWCDGARQDQLGVEVGCDVSLEAVESLAIA